jgi:hypothetical protein
MVQSICMLAQLPPRLRGACQDGVVTRRFCSFRTAVHESTMAVVPWCTRSANQPRVSCKDVCLEPEALHLSWISYMRWLLIKTTWPRMRSLLFAQLSHI